MCTSERRRPYPAAGGRRMKQRVFPTARPHLFALAKELGTSVPMTFEASTAWKAPVTALKEAGSELYMAAPNKVALIAREMVKTDERDSVTLAHLYQGRSTERSGGSAVGWRELLPGQLDALGHRFELRVGHIQRPGPETAVGIDPEPSGVAEDADRASDPVGDKFGGLDLVPMDIQDAEADLPGVAVLVEQVQDRIAVPVLEVPVRELPGPLAAALRLEQRRVEVPVVGVADVHGELGVDPVGRGVESLDHEVGLVGVGAGGRLVDLDHAGTGGHQGGDRRAEGLAGDLHHELPLGRPAGGPVLPTGGPREVVLVVRPVGERVGAGDRDLGGGPGVPADEVELLEMVRPVEPDLARARGLEVVLVVEGADVALELEAAHLADRVLVHLDPSRLAIVHPVEAHRLEVAEGEEGTEVPDRLGPRLAGAPGPERLHGRRHRPLRKGEPLLPDLELVEGPGVERLAPLTEELPARLHEAPDLLHREEGEFAHDRPPPSGPANSCRAAGRTWSLRVAGSQGSRSIGAPFESQIELGWSRSRTDRTIRATSPASSTRVVRGSTTPSPIPLCSSAIGSLATSVSARSTPTTPTDSRASRGATAAPSPW